RRRVEYSLLLRERIASFIGVPARTKNGGPGMPGRRGLERVMGIEPTPSAWEAEVLPLNYTRAEPSVGAVPAAGNPPSEAASHAQERTGVVGIALPGRQARAQVGIEAEQAGAHTDGGGTVAVIEGDTGNGVRGGARHRLQAGERLAGMVLELPVDGEAGVGLECRIGDVAQLPAGGADQRVELLLRVGERGRQAGITLGEAVDLDALGEHADHRPVAQRALAELVARIQPDADVAAVDVGAVDAGQRTQVRVAGDVDGNVRVAGLQVHPRVARAPPEVTAEAGLVLVEAAAAAAPVVPACTVSEEAAVGEIAAVPVCAERQRRTGAVVQRAVVVALEVAPQVHPPAGAFGGSALQARPDPLGAGTSRHCRGV